MSPRLPATAKKRRPYGSGTFVRAANGRIKCRFRMPGGQTVWHWVGTEAEARKWLAEQAHQRKEGTTPVAGRLVTVGAYVERWLQKIALEEARGKSSPPGLGTMEGQRYKLRNYVVRPFGAHKVSELGRQHIDELWQWLRAGETLPNRVGVRPGIPLARKPLKAQTIRHLHHMLHALFDAAVVDEVIAVNPMTRRRLPGIPPEEQFQGVALDVPTLVRVLEIAEATPNGAAITATALLGCRRGELLGLQWGDIHLDDAMPWLMMERSVQRVIGQGLQALPVKTAKSRRPVAISHRLADALRAHRDWTTASEGWVFTSPKYPTRAMAPEYLHRRVWDPIRTAAGIDIRLHDLRHTLRTNTHLQHTVPEAVAMAYFGWTRDSTALDYAHVDLAAQTLPMAAAIDAMLDQAASGSR